MPLRFRKKPVEVEAIRLDNKTTPDDVARWCGGRVTYPGGRHTGAGPILIEIDTLEGVMTAQPGDWIVRGVKGEFYPVKPDIFEATYDAVEA
ncbi:hypothetical protein LTT66_18220 [Nocardia gipuzkoensis]|uniref:hypothetical protein n=1 Tax=Nocardia gipuzkoensis TaxID=2749991 RepID=UPI001E2F22B4|nr:hypothetical protein [Nocardia gipuzkoensis]UGT65306.1 hypothetical protein LTT66_18220 [Nocardia gipuzkoensis]